MKKKLLERTLSVIISLTCSGIVLWLGLSVISTFNLKTRLTLSNNLLQRLKPVSLRLHLL